MDIVNNRYYLTMSYLDHQNNYGRSN